MMLLNKQYSFSLPILKKLLLAHPSSTCNSYGHRHIHKQKLTR
jgi:hypothetical protein